MARDYEKDWNEFWKEIVCNPDGSINLEQVKKELSDFSFVMKEVPKVYCHITGDAMSKVMYSAEDVIRLADEYQEQCRLQEIEDEKEGEELQETSV